MTDSNLDIIRTQEDLINVVSVLYFNLNELERIYYDMFINPTPMDVEFQRYNDLGVLERIVLPNRAKDATPIATGEGNPNNKQEANPGALYLDTASLNLYFKSSGSDNQGWILLYDTENLDTYLKPDGDGSQLQNLNANNITSGVLPVQRGGTGDNGTITGLVKANGTTKYETAIEGTDYIGPTSMVGIVAYYPVNPSGKITGWLVCNGAAYNPADYPRLFNVIGYTYGETTVDGIRKFKVPNFIGHYFKCATNTFATPIASHVGDHSHSISFTSGKGSSHKHGQGDYRIRGYVPGSESVYKSGFTRPKYGVTGYGAFKKYESNVVSGSTANNVFDQDFWEFDADANTTRAGGNRGWSGSSGAESSHTHAISGSTASSGGAQETDVKHYNLVPIIKY